jgi:hypothetical protein
MNLKRSSRKSTRIASPCGLFGNAPIDPFLLTEDPASAGSKYSLPSALRQAGIGDRASPVENAS